MEPSGSKLMKEEPEPATIIVCIRHDSPETRVWRNTTSVGTIERCCRHKVIWTELTIKRTISTYLQSCGML